MATDNILQILKYVIVIDGSYLDLYSLIHSQREAIFIKPSISSDILKIILSLKNTNSVGYDEICTKIIKSVARDICEPISHIINLSISSGIFPDALKTSIIKPIHKKQSKECIDNYRPISLIPVLSKVFERYLYTEINNFFEIKNIFCREQKGFRGNKTINMAIYDFLNRVTSNIDKRKPVCSIFCDMTQAFDYVKHDILLNKLEMYGVRGISLQLIRSYLENRKQMTEIRNINFRTKLEETYVSKERIMQHGVPQGSVLGPLLFIIYINDLPKATIQPMTLFADDSTVTISCNNTETYEKDINSTLTSIISWLDNNNKKINIS